MGRAAVTRPCAWRWQRAPQAASPAPATAPAAVPDETPPLVTADPATAGPADASGDESLPAPGSGAAADEAAGGSAPDEDAAGNAAEAAGARKSTPDPDDGDPSAGADRDGAPDAGVPDGSTADTPGAEEAPAPAPAPAPADGEPQPAPADSEPQPSPAGEAAVLLRREVAAAATQVAEVLDGGDTATALAAMDSICTAATQARRLLKAGANGRTPRGTSPATRPGELRDLVQAHLAAHPGAEFTPHQIGRVLSRSSGAVANALDRMSTLGQAQMTCEKPRRYQAAATTPAPAGTTCRVRVPVNNSAPFEH